MDPTTPARLSGAGERETNKPSVEQMLKRLAETQQRLAESLADPRPRHRPEPPKKD